MIPLRTTEPAIRFPRGSLALVLTWVLADVVSRVAPGSRAEFLALVHFVPAAPRPGAALGWLFHGGLFSLVVTLLYAWTFTPRIFERRGAFFVAFTGASGMALALASYRALHPSSLAPVLAPEAFLGALLGAFMRRDIWGAVDTFVIGPGWARVLEVPSYVLLFFWLFYLLIGNLLTPSPYADAPILYSIPLISFIWGFVLETVWGILSAWTSSSSSNEISVESKSSSVDSSDSPSSSR
jgi:hypothetical protein